jgi:hypothetical protein
VIYEFSVLVINNKSEKVDPCIDIKQEQICRLGRQENRKLEGREGPFISVPGHLVLWVCCRGPFSWLNERVARKLTATQCQMKLSLLKNKLKLFLMLQSLNRQ